MLLTLTGVAGVAWTVKAARTPGLDPGGFAGVLSFGVGLLALVVGLIALVVAWASYQADRRDHADSVRLTDLADDLALKVRAQWEGEGKVRRLYEPGSLTVSWQQAPEGLTEQWSKIREAAERWPRAGSVDTGAWATSPADLAGEGSEIKDVFSRRVPTDRLVVLGQEGAGKTVLLVQLLLDLLVERPAGEGARVPVLFSLASWNPVEESDLFAWMDRRLAIDYEFMGLPAPAPDSSVSRGRALLDRRLILPLLDGFDEIPHGFRMQALMKINEAMVEGQGIVLSCRTQDYRNALSQEPGALGALPVPLERAAGIELQNLDAGIVERVDGCEDGVGAVLVDEGLSPEVDGLCVGLCSALGCRCRPLRSASCVSSSWWVGGSCRIWTSVVRGDRLWPCTVTTTRRRRSRRSQRHWRRGGG
ncbi:NACHT domain-containing protein [Streptomyces sp. NPDC054847]